jgi:hypothetical protein
MLHIPRGVNVDQGLDYGLQDTIWRKQISKDTLIGDSRDVLCGWS